MAYTQMSNDVYIASIPAVTNENDRAIQQDRIVDAGKLNGLINGNATGNIPVSNGTICTNLNAEKLGGNLASAFATAGHAHTVATTSSNGLMSNTDKAKLDTIATSAEVNQMAFSNILVGGVTIQADSKTDTLEIASGANITVTPDAVNDKLTIAVTGTVPSATTAGTCTGNSATATTSSACTGNSSTATTLQTARTINNISFNGSANIIVEPYVEQDTTTNATKYLTFVDSSTAGYQRLNLDTVLTYNPSTNLLATSISGNATTASKLTTARTINGVSFDGSANINIAVGTSFPSGGIIIWSGLSTAIPSGWVLCNGLNGTPNLTNRFVVGATGTYAVGATGGSATHTLTVAEMPSHTHTSAGVSGSQTSQSGDGGPLSGAMAYNTGATGGGGAHNNMPPYYALCYIMKT